MTMWNLKTLAEAVLAAPRDAGVNVGLARDLARAALEADRALSREPGGLLDHVVIDAALNSARFAWGELPAGPTKGNLGAYTIPLLEELERLSDDV